jgi:outer membrane protein OmpA-like peptidoglycan-associated protein
LSEVVPSDDGANLGGPAPDPRRRTKVWIAVLVLLLVLVAALAALWGENHVEQDLEEQARTALDAAGFANVEADFDGREGHLVGVVNTVEDQTVAVAVVGGIDGVRSVDADLDVAPLPPHLNGPFLRATVSSAELVLTGRVQDAEDVETARAEASMVADPSTVDTTALLVGAIGPAPWLSTLDSSLRVMAGVGNGVLRFDNETVVVQGFVVDDASKERIGALLEQAVRPLAVDNQLVSTMAVIESIGDGTILFDVDSAEIKPEGQATLDQLAAALKAQPSSQLTVIGYADSTGSEEHNQALSERRAQAVADYLVAAGVAPEQITTSGRGEADPVADNATAEGRALNRRIEFQLQA